LTIRKLAWLCHVQHGNRLAANWQAVADR